MNVGSEIRDLLREAIRERVASAATAWIWHDGREVGSVAAGRTRWEEGGEIHPGTVFDVASLTKPIIAALSARLVAEGLCAPGRTVLHDPDVSLEHILSHRAGFEAWLPLYQRVPGPERGTSRAARTIIESATRAPRIGDPGTTTRYSDLGFIALIPWLEETAGSSLEQAIADRVTGPLGLSSTMYRPSVRLDPTQIPATEALDHRGGVIQAEVHDDNAHAMGGVSTHAGLFSTAPELGQFAVQILLSSEKGGWLPASLARWLTTPVAEGERTPGWDVKSPEGSSAGNRFGNNSFGHLGYTGCSLWVDPEARLVAVLLTNRVHPTSDNLLIRSLRPRFHDRIHDLLMSPP